MKQRFVRRCRPIVCSACALILAGSFGARAAAQEHVEDDAAEQGLGEHEEHEFHRHHLSVFLGASTREVERHGAGEEAQAQTETATEPTVGLDYEYRLNWTFGVGFIFDYVGVDARASAAGIPLVLHPIGELKLYAAPGLEHHEGGNEFLVRLGLMYGFEVGGWSLSPSINVDFVDNEETYVYGLNVGKGF